MPLDASPDPPEDAMEEVDAGLVLGAVIAAAVVCCCCCIFFQWSPLLPFVISCSAIAICLYVILLNPPPSQPLSLPPAAPPSTPPLCAGDRVCIPYDEKTGNLSALLPKSNNTLAVCIGYKMKEGQMQWSNETEFLFQSYYFKGKKISSPHISAYLTERGTEPYTRDSEGNPLMVNASVVHFTGPPNFDLAYLSVRRERDLRSGTSFWTRFLVGPADSNVPYDTKYSAKMWSKLNFGDDCNNADLPQANCDPAWGIGVTGLTFDSPFTITSITIRYMTLGEILSSMGGLWASCLLLIGIIWVKKTRLIGE